MKVDIYKAIGSRMDQKNWFILIESGKDIKNLIPEKIWKQVDNFSFNKSIEIHPGEHRIALDSTEAITDINKNGYYIQGVNLNINIS